MPAVYFIAGLIAGLAIAWYYTKLHYEKMAKDLGNSMHDKRGHKQKEEDTIHRSEKDTDHDQAKKKL